MNLRKSTVLKTASGTLRKHREPKPMTVGRLTEVPPAPRSLSAGARAEWERLAPIAIGQGTLRGSDLRAFEVLCCVLADAVELQRAITRDGHTVDGRANPMVKMFDAAKSQALRWLDAFGLTPRAANHVAVMAPKKLSRLDAIEADLGPALGYVPPGSVRR